MVGHVADCILDDTPCPRQTIVEDPLSVCHVADGEGLHHPFTQGEGVVTDHEVWNRGIVTGKWSRRWKAKGPVLKLVLELQLVVYGTVQRGPVCPLVHPEELVV